MDTNTILLALGLPTVIAFIAKLWLKSETHEKDIQRIEREVKEVKEIEKQDFNELKKKNENIVIAITKLESLPNDINEIKSDIKGILQFIRK
jgi:hypothetical protein